MLQNSINLFPFSPRGCARVFPRYASLVFRDGQFIAGFSLTRPPVRYNYLAIQDLFFSSFLLSSFPFWAFFDSSFPVILDFCSGSVRMFLVSSLGEVSFSSLFRVRRTGKILSRSLNPTAWRHLAGRYLRMDRKVLGGGFSF